MNLGTQTDAGSPPTRTRRPSLVNRLNTVNRRSTDIGRVSWGHTGPNRESTEFGRVRILGHSSVCIRQPIEAGVVALPADTSTLTSGTCLT